MLKSAPVELPPELASRQKLLVRDHNRRIMLLVFGFFAFCFLAARLLLQHAPAAIILLITAFVLFGYFGFVVVPRVAARQCKGIGFVCPFCDKPLYYQSSFFWRYSSLIMRSECPHCHKSFVHATSSI